MIILSYFFRIVKNSLFFIICHKIIVFDFKGTIKVAVNFKAEIVALEIEVTLCNLSSEGVVSVCKLECLVNVRRKVKLNG